ncbi:MAG: cation:proton antiporter [Gammaproteobacteria bacterium]|nr:cation:proton antiporter [Gammaproteobacteria bacterium]
MDTLAFATIAAGLIGFSLVSKRLETTIVTGPMIFTGFGLVIGGAVLGVADLDFDHGFIHGVAEITLILVLFSDAARIDLRAVSRDHDLPVRMLAIGLPLIIAAGTLVALALPLGLSLWEAALLAAILAPTDAALGQAVVANSLVPARIRQALNIESGLNDGIALPLVLLFACMASASHAGSGSQNWFLFGLMQITLGPVAGFVIATGTARLIDGAVKGGWMGESYEGPAILGVALLAFAGAELIGGNGFIAAFVAGLTFGNQVRDRCGFLFEFAEAEGQLLTLLTFLIFGAAILPKALGHLEPAILIYALLSLTLVRMVPIAIALIGSGLRSPTVGFLGWFGPRGLASMLFALLVLEDAETRSSESILVVVIVTVALSVLAHGLTAAPGATWYGKVVENWGTCSEAKGVTEMPTRFGTTKAATSE